MSLNRNFPASKGFTLIEVLVATGLMALLMLAVGVASTATLRSNQQTGLRFIRNQIVNELRLVATNKKNIIYTAQKPENVALKNCICGQNTCANVQQPFVPITLYDTSDQVQSPTYYDISGGACDITTNPNCPIRVKTTFFAQCMPDLSAANQNPPLSCDGVPAEFIAILYTVDENPTVISSGSMTPFKPISGPAYMPVADLTSGLCP